MWLIDGSKLKATYLNGRYGVDCLEVLRAPTVNAIPVEWIEMFIQRYKIQGGDEYKLLHFMITEWKRWEKENEAD